MYGTSANKNIYPDPIWKPVRGEPSGAPREDEGAREAIETPAL